MGQPDDLLGILGVPNKHGRRHKESSKLTTRPKGSSKSKSDDKDGSKDQRNARSKKRDLTADKGDDAGRDSDGYDDASFDSDGSIAIDLPDNSKASKGPKGKENVAKGGKTTKSDGGSSRHQSKAARKSNLMDLSSLPPLDKPTSAATRTPGSSLAGKPTRPASAARSRSSLSSSSKPAANQSKPQKLMAVPESLDASSSASEAETDSDDSDSTIDMDAAVTTGQKVRFAAGYKGAPKPRAIGTVVGTSTEPGSDVVLYEIKVTSGGKEQTVKNVPRLEFSVVGGKLPPAAAALLGST